MRDLYKVLGIASGADDARVKSAFRGLAKNLHPDLNSGDKQAGGRFKEVRQAYETLTDPKARAAYELGLADERTRARRNMRNVAITMFAISMLSTASIFGALIWLLTVAERPKQAPQLSIAVAGSTAAPVTSDSQPPTALPRQAIAAPPRSLLQPPDLQASLTPCNALLAEEGPGMLGMTLVDQHRAGSSIIVKVDDLDYRATFAVDGRLKLVVPSLADTPVLQWSLADGTPCRQIATVALSPRLRVALVWAGNAGLGMHVIEPNAWLGSPVGHISSDKPNLDGRHGAGQFRTFGRPGDSTRVQLFVVDPARLGDHGYLNAVVVLDRAGVGNCAEVGQTSEDVRYQIYIHHGGRRSDVRRPEVRSMAFQLPRCGEPESDQGRSENILVRF